MVNFKVFTWKEAKISKTSLIERTGDQLDEMTLSTVRKPTHIVYAEILDFLTQPDTHKPNRLKCISARFAR